jgi:hypothetical protein
MALPSSASRATHAAGLALAIFGTLASCKEPIVPDRAPGSSDAATVVVIQTVPSAAPMATMVATLALEASTDAATDVDAAPSPPRVLVVRNEPTKLGDGQVLSGPCVTPAMHAAAKSTLDEDFHSLTTHELDVDGDGTKDFVLNGGAARTTTTLLLYLRRGDCGYDLGSIDVEEDEPEVLRTKTRGLFDLRVVQDLCQSKTGTMYCEVIYKFDGRRYRPAAYKARSGGGTF